MHRGGARRVMLPAVGLIVAVAEAVLLEPTDGEPWQRASVVAIAWAGVVARRRSTILAAAASGVGTAVVAAGIPIDSLALLVLNLFVVGWCGYAARTRLESAAPLLVVVPSIGAVLATLPRAEQPASLAWTVVAFGLAWAVGVGFERFQARAARAEQAARDADMAARVAAEAMIAEDRRRIAQDLHDVVSHSVTLMSVQAAAAARVVDRDPDAARESMLAVQRVGAEAVDELRRMLDVLRPRDEAPPRDPHDDLAALKRLCDQASATGLDVRLVTKGDLQSVAPGPSVAVFRVVQEALTNARRHGCEGPVNVQLRRDGHGLQLEVTNASPTADGVHAASTGRGLLGMRERVRLYGGTIDAGPTHDGRWVVSAEIPLPSARPALT